AGLGQFIPPSYQKPVLMANTTRQLLHFLAGRGYLTASELKDQLAFGVHTNATGWKRYLQVILLALGLGFLACGVIFFLAYNWAEMPKLVKIGLAAAGVVVPATAGLLLGLPPLLRNALLTTAAFMVGGLFAVLGQIYQTGANAYDLFLAWTLFIVVWAVVVDFGALWLLFLTLVNTTVFLFYEQVATGWQPWQVFLLLASVNAGALLVFSVREAPRWLRIVLAIATAGCGTIAFYDGLLANSFAPLPVFSWMIMSVYFGWLAYRRRDLTHLAICVLAGINIGVAWCLYFNDDTSGFTLAVLWTLLALLLGGAQLNRWRKQWTEPAPDNLEELTARETETALLEEIVPQAKDRKYLLTAFHDAVLDGPNLGFRLLGLLGGLLAVGAFLGLLFVSNMLQSELSYFVAGGLLLVVALVLDWRGEGSLGHSLVVALGVAGVFCCLTGFTDFWQSDQLTAVVSGVLCLALAAVLRGRTGIFLATFAAGMSFLVVLLLNESHGQVHAFVVVNALVLTLGTLHADKLLTFDRQLALRYDAIRLGLTLSLLVASTWLSYRSWYGEATASFGWSAVVLIPLLLWVAYRRMDWFGLERKKLGLYLAGLTLLLLPLALAPAAAPALLVLLLGITVNDRISIGLGAMALVYFLGHFYYDLNQTLLFKSVVLLVSGSLLLGAYRLLHPQLSDHEATV
ncbi:MAG: DUF4401 domain-containing protein, partial [Bacteroidota bacterium]